jgi:ubiquinone biosynthesis protein UbiJ
MQGYDTPRPASGTHHPYDTASPPDRATQVFDEIDRLDKAAAALREAVEHMTERLRPVMNDHPRATGGEKGLAVPTVCPVAGRVRDSTDAVNAAVAQLHELLGRLEV